jgi:hypothetical protein
VRSLVSLSPIRAFSEAWAPVDSEARTLPWATVSVQHGQFDVWAAVPSASKKACQQNISIDFFEDSDRLDKLL